MRTLSFLLTLLCSLSAFSQDHGIKKGDRILIGQDELGFVRGVSNDGTIKIESESRIKYFSLPASKVARSLDKCKSKVCPEGRVSFDDKVGTVTDVFSNGVVRIKIDGAYRITYKNVKELGTEVPHLGSLSKGEKVNFDNHDAGIAKEIFSNGNVVIVIDDFLNRMLNKDRRRETIRKIAELGHCE